MAGYHRHLSLIVTFLTCFVLLFVAIIAIRTFVVSPRVLHFKSCKSNDDDFIKLDDVRKKRFQDSLRFRTVSYEQGKQNLDELLSFQKYIKSAYPKVHSSALVRREVINTHSLLYTVQGTNSSLKPYMLIGHLDVVPASEELWEVPPFSGEIRDGFIYGRGAIDVKQIVMGSLEALEFLLERGHTPERSFYLSFGHDEELGGHQGAAHIARELERRGVELEFILDEGTVVMDKSYMAGLTRPFAVLSVTEKGRMTLHLSVNTSLGHASMPPPESSIGILARAIKRLEDNPQPNMFGYGPEKSMIEHMAPQMGLSVRIFMNNLWCFGAIVSRMLGRKPSGNSMIRTTTAVTEFHAGVKSNVLPRTAQATIDHRVHPAQTLEQVVEIDRKTINDDRVHIKVVSAQPPSPVSPYCPTCYGFQTIRMSINQIWTDAPVVPGTLIGATDSVHFHNITKNIYRFSPTYMYPSDLGRFHGLNERMSLDNYQKVLNFYYHLIRNADRAELEPLHEHGVEL